MLRDVSRMASWTLQYFCEGLNKRVHETEGSYKGMQGRSRIEITSNGAQRQRKGNMKWKLDCVDPHRDNCQHSRLPV